MAEEKEVGVSGGKKKVMVAIDGSECSNQALVWTIKNLAPDFNLLVYNAQSPINLYDVSFTASEVINDLAESEKKASAALLAKARTICETYGVGAVYVTEVGDPKQAICKAVEKYEVDLLAIGSHGRGALKSAFMGSVSNYCVHHAKSPVLVVRKTP